METFQVEICETNTLVVTVEAESKEAAMDKVRDDYEAQVDGFKEDSFQDVTFKAV